MQNAAKAADYSKRAWYKDMSLSASSLYLAELQMLGPPALPQVTVGRSSCALSCRCYAWLLMHEAHCNAKPRLPTKFKGLGKLSWPIQ